jgi:hypothetical protein
MTNSDATKDKLKSELDQEIIDDLALANNLYPVKKQEMLIALEKNLGIITPSCKAVGIARQTHYRWLQEDKVYARLSNDVQVSKKDFTESMLYKQVANQNMTAVGIAMRYLKDRGYSDSVEVSGRQGEPIKIVEIKTYEKEEE